MSDAAAATDATGVSGVVRVRVFDADALRGAYPGWDHLARDVRHSLLTDDDRCRVEPVRETVTENLVVDNYLEALAGGTNPAPSHLALGDDASTAADGTNDSLNNEVYRTVVGNDEQDGKDRLTSTFISQNEANGNAIREVGFTTGPLDGAWTLLTHAILASGDQIDTKTSNMTVTIDYILQYRRPA